MNEMSSVLSRWNKFSLPILIAPHSQRRSAFKSNGHAALSSFGLLALNGKDIRSLRLYSARCDSPHLALVHCSSSMLPFHIPTWMKCRASFVFQTYFLCLCLLRSLVKTHSTFKAKGHLLFSFPPFTSFNWIRKERGETSRALVHTLHWDWSEWRRNTYKG